jgi:hypothetical protein
MLPNLQSRIIKLLVYGRTLMLLSPLLVMAVVIMILNSLELVWECTFQYGSDCPGRYERVSFMYIHTFQDIPAC